MRIAGVTKSNHQLSDYPPSEQESEDPEWKELAKNRLGRA